MKLAEAILVFNAGSSSIKFAIYTSGSGAQSLALLYRGQVDGIGHRARFIVRGADDASPVDENVTAANHEQALACLLDWIDRHGIGLEFIAAGHRVVHGGVDFRQPVIVTTDVSRQLEALVPLAPLHQPHNLAAMAALGRLKPKLAQVACFDTAFHHTVPLVEQTFALPPELAEGGLRRYGFHGLSYEYISDVLPQYLGSAADGRVIVAHLGHGASMCALHDRKSMATTMTFTPLDGLPMATRCGSIDPAVVLYLMREKGMNTDAVSDLLHHQSGLLGVSGISGDMRDLLASDSPRAAQAIDLFVHRVSRELGSLAAALGGLEALVFTAGIGEHAPSVRARICRNAAWLGVDLDESANTANRSRISAEGSTVSAWVIPTNEELVIARHTQALMDGGNQ
jgi:acetate kinase